MNDIRQYEMFEEIQHNQLVHFKKLDEKIKGMSEEEKDLLYQQIIKEEEEVKRKIERDHKIYNYLASQNKTSQNKN
jgi:hypothetical protein